MTSVKEDLLYGRNAIAVIGLGFIGTTTAMAFAQKGIKAIGYDINPKKIKSYKKGKCDIMNLENWMMKNIKTYVDSGLFIPTNNFKDIIDCPVHFIAVPTHDNKTGKPYRGIVEKVFQDVLDKTKTKLIVVESTIEPSWIDYLDLTNLPVAVAPRRDWFANPNLNINLMKRIWSSSQYVEHLTEEILSIICYDLEHASTMKVACLGGKDVENALLHVMAVAGQQLANAYDIDINEVLKFTSTHPRLMKVFANIKVGGYCVPLGSEYVINGADRPEELTIFKQAIDYNKQTPQRIAFNLLKNEKFNKIALLGVTYKNDLKVDTLSAVHSFASILKDKAVIHDPYYTKKEIMEKFGVKDLKYPQDLKTVDAIILLTDHQLYLETQIKDIIDNVNKDTFILDTLGVWDKIKVIFENYHRYGNCNIFKITKGV